MLFVHDVAGPPMTRSSSENSTTDLCLDVDATGGEPESQPCLKQVNLFLRTKVSLVFSSRSSRSSSSRTSSSSRAYGKESVLVRLSLQERCSHTDLNDDVNTLSEGGKYVIR
jgi:hypothetical protein